MVIGRYNRTNQDVKSLWSLPSYEFHSNDTAPSLYSSHHYAHLLCLELPQLSPLTTNLPNSHNVPPHQALPPRYTVPLTEYPTLTDYDICSLNSSSKYCRFLRKGSKSIFALLRYNDFCVSGFFAASFLRKIASKYVKLSIISQILICQKN